MISLRGILQLKSRTRSFLIKKYVQTYVFKYLFTYNSSYSCVRNPALSVPVQKDKKKKKKKKKNSTPIQQNVE
jgi:hypothetical protein